MVIVLSILLMMVLTGGAVLVTGGLWAMNHRVMIAERLRDLASPADARHVTDGHHKAYLVWLRRVGRPLAGNATDRREVAELLNAAGFRGAEAVYVFAVLRMGLALVAAALAGIWGLRNEMPPAEVASVGGLGFIVAFLGAKHALRSRAESRRNTVRREMAFVLELMLLALQSGASLDQCLRHAAQSTAKIAPVVHRILTILVHDIGKGTPYEIAIDRWGERLGVDEGRELASLFRQSLLYGAELGTSLKGFVEEFANRRLTMARESVGRKAVQLTIVTVVFLLPPLVALIAGPAFTALMKALEQYA